MSKLKDRIVNSEDLSKKTRSPYMQKQTTEKTKSKKIPKTDPKEFDNSKQSRALNNPKL